MTYRVLYADPPWDFRTYSPLGQGRSAVAHYDVMTPAKIAAYPVQHLAADDCVLLLWVPDPLLPAGFDVITAWGFKYKTVGFYWAKTTRDGTRYPIGTGYWTRANPEICLLAVRGRPKRLHADVRRLIEAPRREHSRKPDEVYDRIERLVSGPYLELFARRRRPGWDAIGFEVDDGPAPRRWHADAREMRDVTPGRRA
jgi:N6-adenosine-specific RNA methylase IME4